MSKPIEDAITKVIDSYPPLAREKLLQLRECIFQVAGEIEGVGAITEALKWGEPAYLTNASKSGSTIRLAWKAKSPDQLGVYFNCQTSLVESFRSLAPELHYEGSRAVVLSIDEDLPLDDLAEFFAYALTYHKPHLLNIRQP